MITNQFTQPFMSASLTRLCTSKYLRLSYLFVTFFLLIFNKCLLKKNCLYIGRKEKNSKKLVGLDFRLDHKLLFGPSGIYQCIYMNIYLFTYTSVPNLPPVTVGAFVALSKANLREVPVFSNFPLIGTS